MATNKVDSIYDIKAIETEQEKVINGLKEIAKEMANLSKVSLGNKKQFEGANDLNQLSEAQKNYATNIEKTQAVLKENEKLLKQKIDLEAKLLAAQSEQAKANAKVREEITKQNAANKDFAKGMNAAADSIVAQRKQLKELTIEYNKLATAERQSEEGQLKAANIKNLSTELSKAEQELGNYTRQVGKYEEAGKAMTQELKAIIREMAAMKMTGADLLEPEKFALYSEKAGELKDTIEGAREEMNFFASDTKNLDGIINGIEGVVGAWGAVQGAMALVGGENKELEETFTKLQAVMTIIQSLQAVQNALQKESAFNMLASNFQRKMQVTLTMLEEKATKQNIATKWLNVAAQKALNLAMSLSPFGMLLLGVGALTAGYFALKMALDNKTKVQKLDNEIMKQAAQNSSDEMIELKASVKQIQEAKAGRGDLTSAIANYNEKFGESGQLTKEIVNDETKFNELIKQQTVLIINRAKAEAYMEKAKEIAKQNIDIQQKGVAWYKELWNSAKNMGNVIGTYKDNLESANNEIADNNKLIEHSINQYVKLTENIKESGVNAKEEAEKMKKLADIYTELVNQRVGIMRDGIAKEKKLAQVAYESEKILLQKRMKEEPEAKLFLQDMLLLNEKEYRNELIKIIQKYNDNLFALNNEIESKNIELLDDGQEKELLIRKNTYEKEKRQLEQKARDEADFSAKYNEQIKILTEKYNADIYAINNKWDVENQKRIQEQAALRLETVEKYSNEALMIEEQSLEAERKIAIYEAEKTGADVVLIEEKYAKKKLELRANYIKNSADMEVQKRININNAAMEAELKELDKQLKKKEITVEEYEKRALEISNKYADLELNNAIVILEEEIKMIEGNNELKAQLEQELIDKKKELYEKDRENFIENEKEKAEKEAEIRQAAAETFNSIMGSVAEIQNAEFENKLTQIDEEQAIADEQLQKDLERAGINEAYKEQLQKQADKRTKDRDKERKKIQLEQAKFEKNKAIFDTIINTATAIVKATPNIPLMILAGATGAAQLGAILATPLPKYAKGRKGGKSEIAVVGEAGPEAVIDHKANTFKIFDKETITHLPAGADVLTAHETRKIMANQNLQSYEKMTNFANNVSESAKLYNEFREIKTILKRKEVPTINIIARDETFLTKMRNLNY